MANIELTGGIYNTIVIESQYTQRFILDSSGNTEYVLETDPGNYNNTSQAVWRIRKIFRTNIGFPNSPTGIAWAEGTTNFDKIADNYLMYSYS